MKILKEIWWQLCGIVACWFVASVADTARYFGVFFNQFHPCVQDPLQSFPCYGIYDLVTMGAAIILGLIFLGILIFKIIHFFNFRKIR